MTNGQRIRRAPIVLLATLAGLAGVLSFRTHPLPQAITPAQGDATSGSSGSASGTAAQSSSSSPPDASSSAASASGTVTGQVASTTYGPVQVKVTYSGSKITDVSAVQLPTGNPQSDFINQQAGPLLREEALQAQSGSINGVSGASYTSAGYQSSLQSALDQIPADSGSSGSSF